VCAADTYDVCHVATNLPAYQVSVYAGYMDYTYSAKYAVDGRRTTILFSTPRSCVHSQLETHPWWAVDLGIPLSVTSVFFTNRDRGT